METPDKSPTAIVLDFPVVEDGGATPFSWPPKMPARLRRRLLAECGTRSPSTVEEIEAKLRHAHLRRQKFYEKLSSKARPKQRSPSRASSQDDDLGQRLEAKLLAAEQKRMSILAKEQLRLAKLDELRQAAKCAVELRHEKERENLGTKVKMRIQQAEENRLLIMKAYKQRRATLKERSSQSLLRRMARENKYKEWVRAAINQKRAAAEKKRRKLLEAEKKRACARMLQVQHVAESVSHQREVERKKLQVHLEDRLQRAKRQRAEYLRQRGVRQCSFDKMNRVRMYKQADILARKLSRCWKWFLKMQRTTLDLTKAHDALGINEESVKTMPFEQLAILIESVDTLRIVKGLLDRLESRLRVSRAVSLPNQPSSLENIDHLLKRVATPKKRPPSRTPSRTPRSKEARKVVSRREAAKASATTSRYPVRVVLCTYMILGHPDAVFSGLGELEKSLAMSAREFVQAFELLTRIILDGPIQSSDEECNSVMPRRWTLRTQLAAFDRAWCTYLSHFVAWKVKDAKMLEDDLVRAACQLELSMIQTCKLTVEGDTGTLTLDMKAIQKQVTEDQKLLREKVLHLSGNAGIERMEVALRETRANYFQVRESVSYAGSSVANSSLSSAAGPLASMSGLSERNMDPKKPSRVVRSLFKEDVFPLPNEFGSLASDVDGNQGPSSQKLVMENEMIVNGLLHDYGSSLADGLVSNDEEENTIKGKVRDMMEKTFWDDVMESMEGDQPRYDRVIQLMKEMRDEICEIVPESWKAEIIGTIDLDILTQVLKSGNLDIDYLLRILKFALGTLQKLSSPSKDNETKTSQQMFIEELSQICRSKECLNRPHSIAMLRGIRFVLEQIQALKSDISKAHIRLMEPMLKGLEGFEYLRSAFTKRFGDTSDATKSLPLTCQWLSSVKIGIDVEWSEHTTSLSSISRQSSDQDFLPSTVLRTGGSFLIKRNTSSGSSSNDKYNGLQECNGEQVDLLVRIGLLKLVCRVSGLTHDTLPETFMLNLSRLRAVQSQIQKIIVISTSILVCRQTILSERVVSSSADMESVISNSTQQLAELLDQDENAGIKEIVDILSDFPATGGTSTDPESRQSRKALMGRMLVKSLQAGDPIFERVSHAVYLGLRAVVLGSNSPSSKKLTEMALRPIGAVIMAERVVEAAEVVGIAASVSVEVHRQWYASIV